MKAKSDKKTTHSAEFMLKEYDHISKLWVNENHQAEQRVSFFLTITSAGVGAIILVFQLSTISKDVLYFLAEGVFVVLLLFGIEFLNRLIARGVQSKAYHRSLKEIQNYFAHQDSEIAAYLERQKKIYENRNHKFKVMSIFFGRFRGELIDIVILENGLICGSITLLVLSSEGFAKMAIVIWTAVTIVGSILFLYTYSLFFISKLSPWKTY